MKSIENLHQDSRRPGWHMNQVPPTYIYSAVGTKPCSVQWNVYWSVNDQLKGIWQEGGVAGFKVPSRHLFQSTVATHEQCQRGQLVFKPRFETEIGQKRNQSASFSN